MNYLLTLYHEYIKSRVNFSFHSKMPKKWVGDTECYTTTGFFWRNIKTKQKPWSLGECFHYHQTSPPFLGEILITV